MRPAGRARRLRGHPALPRRPHHRGARRGGALARARGARAQRADHLLADHRGAALPPRGAPARGRERGRPGRAGAHDRRLAADQDRGQAAAARGAGRDEAAAPALRDPRPRARAGRDRQPHPVAGPVRDGPRPARVLPAPAAEGDPGGARRGRRAGGGDAGAAHAARGGDPPRARLEGGRARARPLRAPPAAVRRARRDPHLPGVDRHPAVVEVDRGQPRPEARAQGARPRPLRHRAREGPHPRVPRGPQAEARRAQLDRLLRRPAGRRQDLARALDRRRHGARLRAHVRGRRARRVGDPRPPPHLHRRHARHDHPRAARRGLEQPGADDRRDRQDGRRLPRRPGERDARGARPRAELELPRPLPGRPVRPLERVLHLHGQPGRHDPAGAARPHGGDRALRLHARGEARDRQALPRAAPDGAERTRPLEDRVHEAGARRDHRRLHARGGRAQPRARRSARSAARWRASSPRARAARSG